jgi:hypothetical protein
MKDDFKMGLTRKDMEDSLSDMFSSVFGPEVVDSMRIIMPEVDINTIIKAHCMAMQAAALLNDAKREIQIIYLGSRDDAPAT